MFTKIWTVSKANTYLEQGLGYQTKDSKTAMRHMRQLYSEFPEYKPAELAFLYLAFTHTGEIGQGIAELAGTPDEVRFDTLTGIARQLDEAHGSGLVSGDHYLEISKPIRADILELGEKMGFTE